MIKAEVKLIAERIVEEVLNKGLGDSTWRDIFPDAFDGLFAYQPDMEAQVAEILKEELDD